MFKKKIFLLILLSTPGAMAQTSMWGAGVYGGMQGCAYPRTAGSGAQDGNDEIKEIQQNIQDMQKQKKQKQTEASRLEKREMKESLAAINDVLSSGYADFVIDHIDNGRSCVEYSGVGNPGDVVANGSDGGSAVQSPGQTPTKPFPPDEWSKLCDRDKPGAVSGSVCVTAKYRAEEKGTHTIDECKKALVDYRKQKQQKDRLMKEIASLDRDLERAKDRLKDAREDAAQAKRDGPSGVDTDTEGGVCLKCLAAA
ncbi:MAG TPA: hypothetical protein VN132_06505, partial [Bdellovibrio sp.]|nr:hypothetical protein [Bdellovibrio sp.]